MLWFFAQAVGQRAAYALSEPGGTALTLIWLVVWLISNLVGDNESLTFDLVNGERAPITGQEGPDRRLEEVRGWKTAPRTRFC